MNYTSVKRAYLEQKTLTSSLRALLERKKKLENVYTRIASGMTFLEENETIREIVPIPLSSHICNM